MTGQKRARGEMDHERVEQFIASLQEITERVKDALRSGVGNADALLSELHAAMANVHSASVRT